MQCVDNLTVSAVHLLNPRVGAGAARTLTRAPHTPPLPGVEGVCGSVSLARLVHERLHNPDSQHHHIPVFTPGPGNPPLRAQHHTIIISRECSPQSCMIPKKPTFKYILFGINVNIILKEDC